MALVPVLAVAQNTGNWTTDFTEGASPPSGAMFIYQVSPYSGDVMRIIDWDDLSAYLLDGENITDDTIDDDSIDFVDVTLADLTFDVGSVSTTEFGYLDGVTSALQTQINAKLTAASMDTFAEWITVVGVTGTPDGSKYLRDDGTWQTISGGGDALVANPLSQFAATTSAQLRGVISDETGTGAAVFATSPTLVTPALGTPSSATLTNATGLPLSTGTTGTLSVTRGGTGRTTGTTAYSLVATGTTATGAQQTLANGATTQILVGGGAAALPVWTTATGSGAPVRATSPTLVSPALGTIASGVGTALTALDGENIQDDTIDDDSIDWSDVTGADITLTDAGAVTSSGTITSSGTFDVTGAAAMTLGSGDVLSITLTTDGTGDGEVVLPTGSISGTEILDDTVDSADYAAGSIDMEHLSTAAKTESVTLTIVEPDQVAGVQDWLALKHFPAELYPSGVTMISIHLGASSAYTSEVCSFEESASPTGSTPSVVESITISSTTAEDDGTFSDGDIAADAWLGINFDATPEDVAVLYVTLTYSID